MSWLIKILPFLGILFTTLVFFYPVFLENKIPLPADFVLGVYHPWLDYNWGYPTGVPVKNPITTDVPSFIFPMQMLAIDLLKSGQNTLWNPFILGGSPLLANFQSAPYSPTNFLYFISNRLNAWSLQIMLQHILAATFTFFLLRHWKVSKIGSVFGGIIFAYSGFNLLWSQWNGHALSAAFIPLILLFTDRFLKTSKPLDGIFLSLAIAGQSLSGYPQVTLYTALAVFVLWIFRVNKNKRFVLKTIFLAGYGLLGLGLTGFQLVPGAELLSLSQREVEPHPFEWAFLPWSKIITFFAPDYYGNHSTQNYWGPQDYTSNTGFVGIVAFVFAIFGISQFKEKTIKICLFILAFSLLLSFPTPVSIYLWKSGALGLQAASAHRALILFNLGIALLAAFGADYFLKNKKLPIARSMLMSTLIIGGFATYTVYMYKVTRANPEEFEAIVRGIDKYRVGLRNLVIPLGVTIILFITLFLSNKFLNFKKAILLILISLSCFELFYFGWKFNPFSDKSLVFPTTPILEYLQSQEKPFRTTGNQVIPINLRMPYKIETLEGYDAVYPNKIAKLIGVINEKTGEAKPQGRYGIIDNRKSQILSIANVSLYIVKASEVDGYGKDFEEVFRDKSVVILTRKDVLPRAKMFYKWEKVLSETETLEKMIAPKFDYKNILLVEYDFTHNSNTDSQGTAVYEKYTETESNIKVSTNTPGLLFVSDTYYPGWKAELDGKLVPIYKANFAFRAIEVPRGEHKVRMYYQPESFKDGLKISGLSLFLLILLSFGIKVIGKSSKPLYTEGNLK